MRLKRLLFFGLLFTAGLINAQTDFRAGYFINLNSDTIFGEIDYRGDLIMGEICRFRINKKEKEIKYTPDDIVAYRFNDGKYFVSKELKGKKIFLEFLINGQINFYYLRDNEGDHYFLEKANSGIIEFPYEKGIKYKDDVPYFYESTKHIGILNYYMQDSPAFQTRIANIGKPEHESLIKLAEDYHNTVCKDRACIIYERKLPPLKFNIEILGGLVNYQYANQITSKRIFQAGVLTHLWMPRVSEKMYLRTGIYYSDAKLVNNGKGAIYKIPIQFEYMYPKGNVRPVMALGINLYSPFYQTVALTSGLNFKLTKSVNLGIFYDIDFNPDEKLSLIPRSIFSQSISTGFIFQL